MVRHKEEIATVLQLEGIEKEELNKANASILSILQKDSDQIQLNVANSIWINDRFHFQDEFAQQNKDYFNAAIDEIDVADKKSPKLLNDWVKASTNNKILEIVDEDKPFNHDLVAYLVNAVYFKGVWMYGFDKEQTTDGVFQLEDETTKDIPLMALYEELAYMENERFSSGRASLWRRGGEYESIFAEGRFEFRTIQEYTYARKLEKSGTRSFIKKTAQSSFRNFTWNMKFC